MAKSSTPFILIEVLLPPFDYCTFVRKEAPVFIIAYFRGTTARLRGVSGSLHRTPGSIQGALRGLKEVYREVKGTLEGASGAGRSQWDSRGPQGRFKRSQGVPAGILRVGVPGCFRGVSGRPWELRGVAVALHGHFRRSQVNPGGLLGGCFMGSPEGIGAPQGISRGSSRSQGRFRGFRGLKAFQRCLTSVSGGLTNVSRGSPVDPRGTSAVFQEILGGFQGASWELQGVCMAFQ